MADNGYNDERRRLEAEFSRGIQRGQEFAFLDIRTGLYALFAEHTQRPVHTIYIRENGGPAIGYYCRHKHEAHEAVREWVLDGVKPPEKRKIPHESRRSVEAQMFRAFQD